MADSPYNLTIALNVLHFLGPNLYSNIPAVLSEMVANAWDADATEVKITVNVENDKIIIEDNGLGMSLEDMNDKYLRVGFQKRSENTNNRTPSGRHFMGRKGIGKLAIFSFAEIMEVQSCKGNQKTGCTMDWNDIAKEIVNNNFIYRPTPIDPQKIDIDKGTRITLSRLHKDRLTQTVSSLRKTLARRFTVIDGEHNFDLRFNGESISHIDRSYYDQIEFIWYLGEESKKFVDKCKKVRKSVQLDNKVVVNGKSHKINGWVATVVFPSDIREDQNNTIALFAHGKLIQEDILSDFQEAQAIAEYVIGDINADFLDADDEVDIVTADRQRVNQNDPRYQSIKQFIKHNIIKEINSNWSLWRLERDAEEALKLSNIREWYNNLNKTNQTKAARLLGKIEELKTIDLQEKSELFRICIQFFDALKDTKGVKTMDEQEFIRLVRSKQPPSPSTPDIPNQPPPLLQQFSPPAPSEPTLPDTEQPAPDIPPLSPSQPPPNPLPQPNPQPAQGDIEGFQPVSPPKQAVDAAFKNIRDLIQGSTIEKKFKEIALSDLNEAYKVYGCGGYKACIVMFGAVLEGVMLAILRKPEVLDELRNTPKLTSKISLPGSIRHPDYADNDGLAKGISEHLTFESYRQLVKELIPDIENLKVEGIQTFRNAIHPWKAIKEPHIYGNYDFTRAMSHLAALEILVRQILTRKLK